MIVRCSGRIAGAARARERVTVHSDSPSRRVKPTLRGPRCGVARSGEVTVYSVATIGRSGWSTGTTAKRSVSDFPKKGSLRESRANTWSTLTVTDRELTSGGARFVGAKRPHGEHLSP
jgi:hypothetical protein